jgi:hypothetical protein
LSGYGGSIEFEGAGASAYETDGAGYGVRGVGRRGEDRAWFLGGEQSGEEEAA